MKHAVGSRLPQDFPQELWRGAGPNPRTKGDRKMRILLVLVGVIFVLGLGGRVEAGVIAAGALDGGPRSASAVCTLSNPSNTNATINTAQLRDQFGGNL